MEYNGNTQCRSVGGGFSVWRLALAQAPARLATTLAQIHAASGVAVLVLPPQTEGAYGYAAARLALPPRDRRVPGDVGVRAGEIKRTGADLDQTAGTAHHAGVGGAGIVVANGQGDRNPVRVTSAALEKNADFAPTVTPGIPQQAVGHMKRRWRFRRQNRPTYSDWKLVEEKRAMGIEPTYPAWKAGALPLSYARISGGEKRIRTSVAIRGRFTVCSLWPLGHLPGAYSVRQAPIWS